MKVNSLYPIIATDNIEETIKFYENFGFTVKHKVTTKTNSHLCVLSNGEQEIELIKNTNNGPKKIKSGIYGLRINAKDIDTALEELKEKNVKVIAGKHIMEKIY